MPLGSCWGCVLSLRKQWANWWLVIWWTLQHVIHCLDEKSDMVRFGFPKLWPSHFPNPKDPNPAWPRVTSPTSLLWPSSASWTASSAFHYPPVLTWIPALTTIGSLESLYSDCCCVHRMLRCPASLAAPTISWGGCWLSSPGSLQLRVGLHCLLYMVKTLQQDLSGDPEIIAQFKVGRWIWGGVSRKPVN